MKKALNTILVTCLFAIILAGCFTQYKEKDSKDLQADDNNNAPKNTSPAPITNQTSNPISIKKQSSMKTLLINDVKYQLQTDKLTPGTKIQDLQLHESAVITNKIVAVVNSQIYSETLAPELLRSKLDGNPQVKKLTDNVFEVSFKNSTTNMYKQYQTLLNLNGVIKVELQIYYNPKAQPEEY